MAVVGYKYYMGIHFIGVDEADELTGIAVGDKKLWEGSITSSGPLSVNKPKLFGGEKREGGISGKMDICFGGPTQPQNAYLQKKLGTDIPAFRNVVSIILNRMYIAANNPYIKPWAFKFKRMLSHGWNSSKQVVGNQCNAAHAVRGILLDPVKGLGQLETDIDDAAFTAAANTLYDEGYGIGLRWNDPSQSIEDFIKYILTHIDGALYVEPATAKWVLKLIRDDYDIEDVLALDQDSVLELTSFERSGPGDLVNDVIVKYEDFKGITQTARAEDVASIAYLGRRITKTYELLGFDNAEIAGKVATRILKQTAYPIAKVKLVANRSAWTLRPGDVFKFSWPALGIDGMAIRVADIDFGLLEDGKVAITGVEDNFSTVPALFGPPPTTEWVSPKSEPVNPTYKKVFELPYYALDRDYISQNKTDFASIGGYFAGVVGDQTGDTYGVDVWVDGTDEAQGNTCVYAILGADLGLLDTTMSLSAIGPGEDLVEYGDYSWAIIDNEIIKIKGPVGDTVTIAKGALDTVPATHTAGAVVYFASDGYVASMNERGIGSGYNVRLTTAALGGELDYADATNYVVSIAGRALMPYPPGNFQINGQYYPASLSGGLTVTWAHRNRLTQITYIVEQSASSVTPETGTTYDVTLTDTSNVVLFSSTGLTGTSCGISTTYSGVVRLTVTSKRDGYSSWQSQYHEFFWINSDLLVQEDAGLLTTEAGDFIELE